MSSKEQAIEHATRLMTNFAERTGLGSPRLPVRYLWTDAFAVCNFLELARAKHDQHFTELALRLVDQVHHVLGRHRADDPRTGWLSGLNEDEGESHPTRGGLRIGKKLPERGIGEALDPDLEWDRDGQYFHYLTKWMFALDQVARATAEPRFNLWARELAEAAHRAFQHGPGRMVWKMSTDLSRPLVPSMGHHDPLDGFITYTQLQATLLCLTGGPAGPSLKPALGDFAKMIEGGDFVTPDPLGLGVLLVDASRVEQLRQCAAFPGRDLEVSLLQAALEGLAHFARQPDLRQPAIRRLAFRELGLAIGLSALALFQDDAETRALCVALGRYTPLAAHIRSFWLDSDNQLARSWSEHRDINEVMLATSLVPEGCLILRALNRSRGGAPVAPG